VERAKALNSIPKGPLSASAPVFQVQGPLVAVWRT
jgi:hypothetical protein